MATEELTRLEDRTEEERRTSYLELAGTMLVAFAGTATLWWAYFGIVAGAVERALQRVTDPSCRGRLARDVFTFAHVPVITGIVLFAVAAKKTVAHPGDPLSGAGRFALGVGIALVLLGLAFGRWRVVHTVAVVMLLDRLAAVGVLAVGVAMLALETAWENRRLAAPREPAA